MKANPFCTSRVAIAESVIWPDPDDISGTGLRIKTGRTSLGALARGEPIWTPRY